METNGFSHYCFRIGSIIHHGNDHLVWWCELAQPLMTFFTFYGVSFSIFEFSALVIQSYFASECFNNTVSLVRVLLCLSQVLEFFHFFQRPSAG